MRASKIATYQVVIGFLWLYAVLRVLCPSGSAVPRQALRLMFIVSIGAIFTQNVASSRNVRVPAPKVAASPETDH